MRWLIGASLLPLFMAVTFAQVIPPQPPTHTHKWYDASCCSGRDCQELDMRAVKWQRDGLRVTFTSWLVGPVDVVVPFDSPKIKPSKDANYHACAFKMQGNPAEIRCLYVPMTS